LTRFISIEQLFTAVHQSYTESKENIFVILVGGCSRAGKSTLSSALAEQFKNHQIESRIVNIDSWLISVDKRKPGSKVAERYDLAEINLAVEKILNGETVFPPIYDPATRKRIEGVTDKAIQLNNGVLIVEGVVTMSDRNLLSKSHIKIFVDIADTLRIKRLIDFYSKVKKVERETYKQIILDREKEETLFVKATAENADLLFAW
jgi:uridine kinase